MKLQWKKNSGGSLAVLAGLVFSYILLVALVLLFSQQVLLDFSLGRTIVLSVIAALTILFSLLLLFVIGAQSFELFRGAPREKPGVRFKLRLVIFFLVVIVLSSVPQAFLCVSFINSSLLAVFNSRVGQSLAAGRSIALEYYTEKAQHLEELSGGAVFRRLLSGADREAASVWDQIRVLLPGANAFQVFRSSGARVYEAGDSRNFMDAETARLAQEGPFPREITASGADVLRTKKSFENRRGAFFAVLTVAMPADFAASAEDLAATFEAYRQFEQYRPAFLAAIMLLYGFFSFPLMLLAVLASFRLSDEIVRPIASLEEATRKVAEGDFSFRILFRSGDELSSLAGSFNSMVMELEKSRLKSMQTEKVAAWQEIAQRLAHEIKNPLTPIKLSAQRIQRRYSEGAEDFEAVLDSSVAAIIHEVDSLDALLTEFRSFSRLPAPKPEPVILKNLILESAAAYRGSEKILFRCDEVPAGIRLALDPGQMKQVFSNLVTNAIDAMPEGGEIIFRAALVKKGNSRYCRIEVEDTGEGIREEDVSQVFNPYYTTKSYGTGLGLSVVERIIFDHKGQVWFESHPGVGTTFFIDLPASPASGAGETTGDAGTLEA
ncbi:MAG: HAMP domain-containing protein [Spirochaetales bacterium]|jgi:nitrogen fixation/metabolism regulation signal transduction histidine kinase|nr:HAMP domain-containing protein [Spirochaetales bacterium]